MLMYLYILICWKKMNLQIERSTHSHTYAEHVLRISFYLWASTPFKSL